jgi:hypothetical protein
MGTMMKENEIKDLLSNYEKTYELDKDWRTLMKIRLLRKVLGIER